MKEKSVENWPWKKQVTSENRGITMHPTSPQLTPGKK